MTAVLNNGSTSCQVTNPMVHNLPINGPPPLYTVEQLELIRRLKNSGLTKDDVVTAYESLDKVDKDLGPVYNIPVNLALQAQALQLMALGMTNSSQSVMSNPPTNNLSQANNPLAKINQQLLTTPIKMEASSNNTYESPNYLNNSISSSQNDCHNNNTINNLLLRNQQQQLNQQIQQQLDSEVDAKELFEFMKLGDVQCCEEIRSFAAKHNIKQQQIATLAGICQSYVSRYMKGDIYDMSERSRRAIQKWFIIYRKNPASIATAANASLLMQSSAMSNGNNMSNPARRYIAPSALDLELAALGGCPDNSGSMPRRERFVFRPSHLEILEKYFRDNNYPSYETRDQIAQACNVVTETVAGRELTKKKKVPTATLR